MKDVLGSLPEVITAYKNYNLLVPTATDVQLNPFYKFHVEEVPVDLGENSGDIFKVGSVKTGKQDERGKDIWEDVYSLSKPLLNKMAMAAGIQFNPKETYGERIDRVTYRAQAQGAMRKADGTARTETDVLERIESMEKEMEKLTDRKFILSSQLTGMDTMIEKMRETFSVDMVEETDRQIRSNKETLGELQIQKGVLLERLENIDTMRGEISTLNNGIAVAAGRADCYEALKQAFSQDGVPHQIIRNIIPHITDTTNNILGQMTGGTMGVEFVMERTVKGKDGDKATLDVLINEYGKTTLPYASKSGGEKVKASLAVILALSEIKATAAGIQLGMLFIDEPPFLDDEGAQAYVDALETIRDRYSDVKIMAITHDDAMKARFGQAVTVIKTDDGSKVIY